MNMSKNHKKILTPSIVSTERVYWKDAKLTHKSIYSYERKLLEAQIIRNLPILTCVNRARMIFFRL